MKINIYTISKQNQDEYDLILKNFIKMSSKYAKVEIFYIFNKKISKAQNIGEKESRLAYSEVYEPLLSRGYNVALDVLGKKVDTFEFSQIFKNKSNINLFIGGSFGFDMEFLKKCDSIISLSSLTMAHKVATIVIVEQVFRALSILNNHPYHK